MALGSGRARIVRQVLTESLALALPGGIVGVSVAFVAVTALNAWKPLVLQSYPPLSLDLNTLAFSLALTLLTALIFGIAPALTAARISIQDALKSAGPMQTGGRTATRMRRMLVVIELEVSLILLISTGLLGRSFVNLATTKLGFPAANIFTLRLNLTGSRYAKPENQVQFYEEVLERVRQLPQVKRAAFSTDLPLSGDVRSYSGAQFEVAGRPLPMAQRPRAGITVVSREFFKTLGIPLRSGRVFDSQDSSRAAANIVINEALAKRIFPGEDPLNHRILIGPNNPVDWRIVGVVGNIRGGQLGAEPSPLIYRCLCQGGSSEMSLSALLIRTTGDPHSAIHAIESQIYSVDRNEPVFDIKTMEERLADSLAPQRFHLLLIGTFTMIAVVLSAVGVYGVMAYLVTQRRREIGIRIAMGAQLEHVFRLVLGESITLAMLAVVAGLVGARGSMHFLHSMLYGVTTGDALTFTIMPFVLVAIAITGSIVPTMKALQIDPTVALREE